MLNSFVSVKPSHELNALSLIRINYIFIYIGILIVVQFVLFVVLIVLIIKIICPFRFKLFYTRIK